MILAARKGVQKATSHELSRPFGARLASPTRGERAAAVSPLLMASIQLDKDPHFRKIEVDYNLCDVCGACIKVCPTEAFGIKNSELEYKIERCFGCGICPSHCHVNALNMVDTKPSPIETLNEMILLGVKAIEFHFGKNIYKTKEIWDDIKDLLKSIELISFSIGSDLLSDEELKFAANLCYGLAGEDIILQCDGKPMSGFSMNSIMGNNNGSSCLHVARVIQEENLPVYLQISGGTDHNSFNRALSSGININGMAVGSYARKLLMPYLNDLDNKVILQEAVQMAESLVRSVNIEDGVRKHESG